MVKLKLARGLLAGIIGPALVRSKGGGSTKVHAATGALGNPVHFILAGGERNDITQIEGLHNGLKAGHGFADMT